MINKKEINLMSHWLKGLTIFICLFTVLHCQIVKNVLVGGLTDISFVMKGRTEFNSLVCTVIDSGTAITPDPTVKIKGGFFTIEVTGLTAKKEYIVKICEDASCAGSPFTRKVTTIDPTNMSFIATSNIDSNSNSFILERIQNEKIEINPAITNTLFPMKKHIDFIMILGNIHSNPKDTDSEEEYISRYDKYLFENEKMKDLLESHPVIYFFNDLDFAGSKSNSKSKGVDAINSAYRKIFPSYALPADNKGIYQSFQVGTIKFIMTDSRTFMDVKNGKLFGDTQLAWIKKEFSDSLNPLNFNQIFITVTQPWNYVDDKYSPDIVKQGYESLAKDIAKEKDVFYEILDNNNVNFYFPKESTFISVILIVGERHLAFDNGNWNNYGSFPMVVCGPLDSWQQCRGGPYSHGSFHDAKNQYCLFNTAQVLSPLPKLFTSLAGVLADKDDKIGDQFVFGYNTFLPEKFTGRLNLKCPIDWKEKLIHAAILVVVGVFTGFIFFFYFYWVSIKKLSFQHVKFKTN